MIFLVLHPPAQINAAAHAELEFKETQPHHGNTQETLEAQGQRKPQFQPDNHVE